MDNYIVGRNAVKEALKSGRSIQRILVSEDKVKTGLADIVNLAKSQGIELHLTPIQLQNMEYGIRQKLITTYITKTLSLLMLIHLLAGSTKERLLIY